MKLLVQLNFEQFTLPGSWLPNKGLLAVFVSEEMRTCPHKDRNCFKVIWQQDLISAPYLVPSKEITIALEQDAQSPLLSPQSVAATEATATTLEADQPGDKLLSGSYLLGDQHPRLEEAQASVPFHPTE